MRNGITHGQKGKGKIGHNNKLLNMGNAPFNLEVSSQEARLHRVLLGSTYNMLFSGPDQWRSVWQVDPFSFHPVGKWSKLILNCQIHLIWQFASQALCYKSDRED